MRVLTTLLFATTAVAALSSRVAAQSAPTPTPTPADKELARRYVDSGLKAQDARDYDVAIDNYEKAYRLVPHPVLLFDMAQAYRLARKADLAITFYNRYLATPSDGLKTRDACALLAELQAGTVDPTRRAAPALPAVCNAAGDAAAQSPGADPSGPLGLAGPASTPAGSEPSDVSPGQSLRWTGIATMGVGVVSLAVGAGYAIHSRSLSDEVSKQYDMAKDHEGQRANTIAITGLVAGTGLVAIGGALWWWAGHRSGGSAQISVAPALSGQLMGFAISGTL